MFYVYSYYDVYIEISYTQKNMAMNPAIKFWITYIFNKCPWDYTLCTVQELIYHFSKWETVRIFLPSFILKAMIHNINIRL